MPEPGSEPEADILCTEEDVIDVFAGEGEEPEEPPVPNPCELGDDPDGEAPGCLVPEPDCDDPANDMNPVCIVEGFDQDEVLCGVAVVGSTDLYDETIGDCAGPQILTSSLTAPGSNTDYAKGGDTITLTFESSDEISNVLVDFKLGGTLIGAGEVAATATDAPDNKNWEATLTAPSSGDGPITADIKFKDADGNDQDPEEDVGGVTLDNTDPVVSVAFTNAPDGFVASDTESEVAYDLTVGETNLDDTLSTHDWDANDGTNSGFETPEHGTFSFAGPIEPSSSGTFNVDVTIVDLAGNSATANEEVDYHLPGLLVTLESNNGKGHPDLALEGDVVTLTFMEPDGMTSFSLDAFDIGDADALGGVTVTPDGNTPPEEVTVTYTVPAGAPEGEVTFEASWDEIPDPRTSTTDGSSVVVDLTAPDLSVGSFQFNLAGDLAVGPTETIKVELTFPLDLDIAASSGTVTGTPDDTEAPDEEVTVDFSALTGVEDAETVTYTVEVPSFGEGTLSFDFALEDLAGNLDTSVTAPTLDVVFVDERLSATIEEGGMDAVDDIRYMGRGDFASRTYDVTVTHDELSDDSREVAMIAIEFDHALGDAFQVTSVTSDDFALIYTDNAGAPVAIEIELDNPLSGDSYGFSFTVANNYDATAPVPGGLASGDSFSFEVAAYEANFEALGELTAGSTVVADVDGPGTGTMIFPVDANADDVIGYLEFIDDPDGIVIDLAGFNDELIGGSGVASIEAGFYTPVCLEFDDADPENCLDVGEEFTLLGTAIISEEETAASIPVDDTLLGHGDIEFAAFATDTMGNVGDELRVTIDVAIRQFLVVSPPESTAWVAPSGLGTVSFTITPDDVDQGIKRFDFRVGNDEYALAGYFDDDASAGADGAGNVVNVRYQPISSVDPFVVDGAVLLGKSGAAHGTESEFDLIALNTDGKSGPLTIVDEDYNAFTGPVFTATVDAEAPDLTFVEIEEPADENGNYAAGTGEVLTFTFTVSDDDSGLPDTDAVDIEVYDSDADSWSSVAGAVLDITEGTIEIPREDPGRFTYRLTAVDNVGNLAFDESIGEINVLGVVTATIDSIGVQQDADGDSTFADLGALGGVFYADLDSDVPGDDAGDADQVLFTANVLLDGTPEGGVTVELHFGDGIVLTTTTDDDGDATWLVDPDDHDLDLASTPFDVVVPSQEFSGETADFVVTGDSDSTEVLWTGFYLDVGGDSDADLETPFDLDAGLYWLHDVFVAGAIDLTGASTIDAGAFTGSIGLTESVGGQEMTAVNVPAESGTAPTFSVTRGTGPVPGVDVDTEAGYREYTPFVDGDLPAGMAGTGLIVAEGHEVLISGVRLVFDSIDQLGVAGDDASVEVSAQWLHDTLLDGTTAETRSIGELSFDLITDKPSVFGTGPHTLGAGEASLGVDDVFESGTVLLTAGESADDGLFPVVYDATAEMHGMDVGFFPVGGVADDVITPGGDFAGDFAIVIDSVPVDDTFPGVAHSLSVNLAGDAATDTVFDAVPISGQSPFSIVDSADQVQTPSVPIAYDGGASAWTIELGTPDLGIYSLEVSLVVSDNGGAPVTVGLSDPFSVKYEVYRITEDETTQDESTLTSEDGTFWVDRDVTSDVTHAFFVDIVESDGESDTVVGSALDGTVVQVWSSDDDGTTWTQFGTDITLSSGGDTGEASFDIPRSDDSVADTLFRIVVTEDHIGTPLDNSDGLGDATLLYDTRFIFTGVTVEFTSDGADLTQLVDEDVPVTVEATYDHNGAPVEALEVTIDATGLGAPVVVTTGATGMAATTISLDAPGVIDDLDATITGGLPHGLTATTDEVYDGTLTWVDLRTGDLLVEADSGSGFAPVDEDSETAGLYTVPAGSFVKVTVPVELDDGTTTTDIESGTVFFGATSKAISGGEAVNTYFRSSAGTSGDVPLSVEDATAGGTNYGDLPDAGSFKIVWE